MTAMTREQLAKRVGDLAREVGVRLDRVRSEVGASGDLEQARQATADAERLMREMASVIWSMRGERARQARANGPQR